MTIMIAMPITATYFNGVVHGSVASNSTSTRFDVTTSNVGFGFRGDVIFDYTYDNPPFNVSQITQDVTVQGGMTILPNNDFISYGALSGAGQEHFNFEVNPSFLVSLGAGSEDIVT